jgi:hypothetical protein
MEQQVVRLKLNAENIKSTLIRGNKDMKKLRLEQSNLLKRQKQKQKARMREDYVEGKKKEGVGSKMKKGLMAGPVAFMDRIKDFLLLVGGGILLNNLGNIIAGVEKFIKDNEGIIKIIQTIVTEVGNLAMVLIDIVNNITPERQKELEQNLEEFENLLGILGMEVDGAENDLNDLNNKFNNQKGQQTPPPPSSGNTSSSGQRSSTNPAAQRILTAYELVVKTPTNAGTGKTIRVPNVGSFVSGRNFFGFPEDKYFDPAGNRLTKDEFVDTVESQVRRLTRLSIGGTVKGSPSGSKIVKTSVRPGSGIDSFSTYNKNSFLQSDVLIAQGKENSIFSGLLESFEQLKKPFLDLFGVEDNDNKYDEQNRRIFQMGPSSPPSLPDGSGKGLFDTISGHEGGLNSVNMGTAGDTPGGSMSVIGKNLTDMTIAEVHANQHPNGAGFFAVGKYQIVPKTMVGFIGYLKKKGINPKTTKFDVRIQNMFGNYTLSTKRPSVGQFISGQKVTQRYRDYSDMEIAQLDLAAEFASIGVPRDMKRGEFNGTLPVIDIKRGDSLYKGAPGGNAAGTSPDTIRDLLLQEKSKSSGQSISAAPKDSLLNRSNNIAQTTEESEGSVLIIKQPIAFVKTKYIPIG